MANDEVRDPAAERVVFRPHGVGLLIAVPLIAASLGVPAAVLAAALLHGEWLGLLSLPITAGLVVLLVYLLGATLWADREYVGITWLFGRDRCRRQELASLQTAMVGRAEVVQFIRHDRSVAFTIPRFNWSRLQLRAMAAYLGLPFESGLPKTTYGQLCPVCGFPGLLQPAATDGMGSGEICPACGFEHRGPVDQQRYGDWRQQWVAGGMKWYGAIAGVPQPKDWDPESQLKALAA